MKSSATIHPADETLVSYGLGKLDDTAAESVNEHLEQCTACRRRVAELSSDSFVERLREAQARPADVPARRKEVIEPDSTRRSPFAGKQASTAISPVSSGTFPPEFINHPDYEVIRVLGRGGMGVVYLARNKLMDRLVVLKVLNRHRLAHQETVDRFLREIRSAAKLHHPNVVTAFDAFLLGEMLVFAMEYVEGDDLAKVVHDRGPFSVVNACYFAYQAAQGLQHAHERGMIHRDIKPGNLILCRHNKKAVVKILDFGLAKITTERGIDRTLTQVGQILGTPDYIAPEQIQDPQKADIRADIYSLGCTLYHLLTGDAPFSGNSLYEILQAHQFVDAKPLNAVRAEVPAELAAVVAKMMAKDPKHRYQTPADVVQALKPFLRPGGLTDPPTEPSQIAPRLDPSSAVRIAPRKPRKRWPTWLRVTVVVDTILVALAIAWAAGVFSVKTNDGVIVLRDLPDNADVFVDGEKVTVRWPEAGGPAEITVPPGKRGVKVTKDGFVAFGEEVTLSKGERRWLTVTLMALRQPAPTKPQDPEPAPTKPQDPAAAKDYLVLHQVPPTVVGTATYQRVGFPDNTLQTVFDSNLPRILVPEKMAAAGPLNITRLFLCREDGAPSAANPKVYELRQVNLWVPVKEEPYAQAVHRAGGKTETLQPTRPLPDGVYCVHTGILADSKPPPDFCCPFIVRGYGVPQIEKATAIVGTTEVKLTVGVRNAGLGEFNDGFIVATMQKREGTRPEFKGRQHRKMPPIPAKGQQQMEFRWKTADLKPGIYYFHGHINYEHLWDPNALATFDTDTFVIGGTTGAARDQEAPPTQEKR